MTLNPALWGSVLQDPNVAVDTGGADRRRALWMTRQGEMATSQLTAQQALEAALKAARDKQMADLAAADALKLQGHGGGGGGGRRSGGGGSSTGGLLPPPAAPTSWLDQIINGLPAVAPPPAYSQPSPSSLYGPNSIYTVSAGHPVAPVSYTTKIQPGQKGYRPAPLAKPKPNPRIS